MQMKLAAYDFVDGLLLASLIKRLRKAASSAAFQYLAVLVKGYVAVY